MSAALDQYRQKLRTPRDATALVRDGDTVLVAAAVGEPPALLRARACSYAAVLGEHTLTIYAGITFPVRRVVPRRAVTGVQQFRSPLLRLAGATVLVISAPGARVLVPAVPAAQAAALACALAEDAP